MLGSSRIAATVPSESMMSNYVSHIGAALYDEDQLAELLVKLNLESHDNVSSGGENARKQTAVVAITSQYMRKLFKRFPELLLIDWSIQDLRLCYINIQMSSRFYPAGTIVQRRGANLRKLDREYRDVGHALSNGFASLPKPHHSPKLAISEFNKRASRAGHPQNTELPQMPSVPRTERNTTME
ncbi:unnamed protein product [Phytophthora fragariaefolia]|uniref:Unnamed protein product n=1 Tax=Phytophthora fragariaefolia TaxID=1490495 RepID=A0A9W6WXN7_9STRA|nr:unnamed protein product [Phytophthora fragariaefolia]